MVRGALDAQALVDVAAGSAADLAVDLLGVDCGADQRTLLLPAAVTGGVAGRAEFGGVQHDALTLSLVDRHVLDGQRLVLDAEQREHLVVGDVPALAASAQVLCDAAGMCGGGDVLDLDPELLGDVLAVLRDEVLRDDEQHLVARAVAHRALRVAGGAEGLAAALLPAEDEPAAVLGLGQGASQVLALEALPVERRVLPVGAAVRGDLIEYLALALDLLGEACGDVSGVGNLEVLKEVLDVLG